MLETERQQDNEPQEGEEQSEQPTESGESAAGRATGWIDRGRGLARGAKNLGAKVGGGVGKFIAGAFGTRLKIGFMVINVGIVLLATILFVIGLSMAALGNSGTGGTAPVDPLSLDKPETLEDLQLIQCLQEEVVKNEQGDGQLGPECSQRVLAAIDGFKKNAEILKKKVPATTEGKEALKLLDETIVLANSLTETRQLKQLKTQKEKFDAKLAELNRKLSSIGVAGGFGHLVGKESTIKLGKIRVIRNKFVAQLLDETGIVIASARIGIGDGAGSGGNYLKTSGFASGDNVTPLGNFTTCCMARDTVNGIRSSSYAGADGRGSYMGQEVIQYIGGVASPERGLLFHSGKLEYDQRDPLPLTKGCVRLTSTDMRTLYNIVQAQTDSTGKQKSISVEIIDQ